MRLSATVRLHALVGKKDGQTLTPNEEMKLDCQDLSGLVLTRCRLFKCLCDYIYVKCEFMCGKSPVSLEILSVFLHSTTRRTIETIDLVTAPTRPLDTRRRPEIVSIQSIIATGYP